MTPIDPTHPVVRAAAEGMAKERWDTTQAVMVDHPAQIPVGWDMLPEYGKRAHIETHARLLCDMTRDASRDFWVRWLGERDTRYRSADIVVALDALRDNPEALTAAVLAALESR